MPGIRDRVSLWSERMGVLRALSVLPKRQTLLVLNYHRIGDPAATLFDPGVFSASEDVFDRQIAFLKRHFRIIGVAELLATLDGTQPLTEPCTLITFDDGYIDNYKLAMPILASHSAEAVFFIPTAYVETNRVPWWDAIAFILKTSRRRKLNLGYPATTVIDLDLLGLKTALRIVLDIYKSPGVNGEQFLSSLEEACAAERPAAAAERLFVVWEEIRDMLRHGMAIGSHTHSHRLLGHLSREEQLEELVTSKRILEEQTGVPVHTIAYPVGKPGAVSPETMQEAARAGYRAGFSFYGGVNRNSTDRFNVLRCPVDPVIRQRFELQALSAAVAGIFWP